MKLLVLQLIAAASQSIDAGAAPVRVAELEVRAKAAYDAKAYGDCARDYREMALRVRGERDQRNQWYSAACCEALAGRADAALTALERAEQLGLRDANGLQHDDDFASVSHLPRFTSLVEKVAARDLTRNPELPQFRPASSTTTCELSPSAKNELLALDYWAFDQSPHGWRQFQKSQATGAAPAEVEACERLVLDLLEAYVTKYGDTLTATQNRVLIWHAGQLAAFLGETKKALANMKQTLDSTPVWNSYARATIAFLEHDHERLLAERQILAELDGELFMRINMRVVDSFVRCFDSSYKAAYTKTCKAETPAEVIGSLSVKVEPALPLPHGVGSFLQSKKVVFVAGELGVQQVPHVFAQVIGSAQTGSVAVLIEAAPKTQRAIEQYVTSKNDQPLRQDRTTHGNLVSLVAHLATTPKVSIFAGPLAKLDVVEKAKSFDRVFVLATVGEGSITAKPCGAACQAAKSLGDGQVFTIRVRHEKGTTWACDAHSCTERPVQAAPAEYIVGSAWDSYFLQEPQPVDGYLGTVFVRVAHASP